MKRGFGGRVWLAVALLVGTLGVAGGAETWRGLVVADEDDCSPYDRARDYSYPQAIEHDIVRRLGAVDRAVHGDALRVYEGDGD